MLLRSPARHCCSMHPRRSSTAGAPAGAVATCSYNLSDRIRLSNFIFTLLYNEACSAHGGPRGGCCVAAGRLPVSLKPQLQLQTQSGCKRRRPHACTRMRGAAAAVLRPSQCALATLMCSALENVAFYVCGGGGYVVEQIDEQICGASAGVARQTAQRVRWNTGSPAASARMHDRGRLDGHSTSCCTKLSETTPLCRSMEENFGCAAGPRGANNGTDAPQTALLASAPPC